VIEYVTRKYGQDRVSQIITHGTMAAKAVVRDVGRVLDHPYGYVDKIAKLVPHELEMTLDKALEQEPLLKERYENEEDVRALIDTAKTLEAGAQCRQTRCWRGDCAKRPHGFHAALLRTG